MILICENVLSSVRLVVWVYCFVRFLELFVLYFMAM